MQERRASFMSSPFVRASWMIAVSGVALAICCWIDYALLATRPQASAPSVWFLPFILLSWSWILFSGILQRGIGMLALVIRLIFALNFAVWTFATVYFRYGTSQNFGAPLSGLDAIYVALGVLSTAGISPFTASTQFARMLIVIQYAVDVPLTLVAVAMAVSRLSSHAPTRGS
jgi:ion channel